MKGDHNFGGGFVNVVQRQSESFSQKYAVKFLKI